MTQTFTGNTYQEYTAVIGWDVCVITTLPQRVVAASPNEALNKFRAILRKDAETNIDRYDGDVESIDIVDADGNTVVENARA